MLTYDGKVILPDFLDVDNKKLLNFMVIIGIVIQLNIHLNHIIKVYINMLKKFGIEIKKELTH